MTFELSDIPPKELAPGIVGKYIHSKNMTIGYVEIKKGAILPAHSHVNEQTTQILSGKLEMVINDETTVLNPGTITIIPSNSIHSAIALTDCVIIDSFFPIREDYK